MNFGGSVDRKWLKKCKRTRLSSFPTVNLTGRYLKTIIVMFSFAFFQSTTFALVGRCVHLTARTWELGFEIEGIQNYMIISESKIVLYTSAALQTEFLREYFSTFP